VFNLSGSELVFLLLLALIVLGPEKLPEAVRRFGKTYAELKKMSSGFQNELRSALDEPMREMRETADALRKAVDLESLDKPELPPTPPTPQTPPVDEEPKSE
jgi:sec-independent protein translocase protein TatB